MLTTKNQSDLETLDDVALVFFAKQGDHAAFDQLIKRHMLRILRVVMRFTKSREDAEDIAQDAFLKAFQHLDRFEERARFTTWLTRIAVNEALMRIRGARRGHQTVSMDEELEESRSWGDTIADTRPNPEQLCNGSQFRVILQQGLAALPDTYRVVFMLREVEGLSTADTAKVLGLCVPHVKTRLFRARLKLRKRLSQYCECNRITAEPSMPLRHILGGPQTAQVH